MARRRIRKIHDPHAKREASKYSHPIPSREYILEYLQKANQLVSFDELTDALQLTEEEQRVALQKRLRAMERDAQIVRNRRGGYGLIKKLDLIRGHIQGHKDGFGFVIPDTGRGDLYLNHREMRKVFNGDTVLARVVRTDRRGRLEAQIVEVLESNTARVVGRLITENGVGYVISENKRITQEVMIPHDERGEAKAGQIVTAEIIAQPTSRARPVGRIVEVLGEHMAPGMEIDIALRSYDLPYEWPAEVLAEIKQFTKKVPEHDKVNRRDLRELPLVTIDGEDARDFDDAVYCKPKPQGGWTLYVAIADVSHYVKINTALDEEAQARGNSVYFPGEVIPMLPEILSNELCSLNPHVDRLCMICEVQITAKGTASRSQFYTAVMQSHARLTYTEVAAFLSGEHGLRRRYEALGEHLTHLHDLYQALHAQREKRGAIDFETTETRILFDKARKIKAVVPVYRNVAHRIIEECMLCANVSTAKWLMQEKMPALYRIHEQPDEDKILGLREFLSELGLQFRGGREPSPKEYGKILKQIEDRPDQHLIQTVLLRSLPQAMYSPDNVGHFGLAYQAYTHFTSPIRRYPDLIVHRAIKQALKKQPVESFEYAHDDMAYFGDHCSSTERRADEATRDVVDWLKCEYMQDKIGDQFDGIITSVTGFGLFVELAEIYVDGLVHVTALPNDFYHFDPDRHHLMGERTAKRFRLGDSITVRVVRVDLDERKIDFELA